VHAQEVSDGGGSESAECLGHRTGAEHDKGPRSRRMPRPDYLSSFAFSFACTARTDTVRTPPFPARLVVNDELAYRHPAIVADGGSAKPMGLPTQKEAAGPPKRATLARKIPDANADLGGTVVCPSLGADRRGASERRRAVARLRGGPCVLPLSKAPRRSAKRLPVASRKGLPLDGVAHDTRVPLFALDQDHTLVPLRALCGERPGALHRGA
jgi:hypothetical protein